MSPAAAQLQIAYTIVFQVGESLMDLDKMESAQRLDAPFHIRVCFWVTQGMTRLRNALNSAQTEPAEVKRSLRARVKAGEPGRPPALRLQMPSQEGGAGQEGVMKGA